MYLVRKSLSLQEKRREALSLSESDSQILRLSEKFYRDYPNPPYKEILKKKARGYNCLLFQTHYEYFICIPYRTEIQHRYAYKFKNSYRSQKHNSGLDYSKMVIIKDADYLDDKKTLIDRDEYKETMINLGKIKKDALKFLEEYINHMQGQKLLHTKEFTRRYQYSSLQYFHSILGIPKSLIF